MAGIPETTSKFVDDGTIIKTSKLKGSAWSILVNISNIKKKHYKLSALQKRLKGEHKEMAWHRFTVYNEALDMKKYEKRLILKTITDFLYPDLLLPVYYQQNNGKCYFLARNCMDAIYRIIDEEMEIPNPWDPEHPFKINLVVNISNTKEIPVPDAEDNICYVLKKRVLGKVLDLERFSDDQGLIEFCPLSQPKLLVYVLFLAEKFKPETVILCKNDIRSIPPMDLLSDSKIKSINLKHNLIADLESLKSLGGIKSLRELDLDDNPLCEKFDNEFDYFYSIKGSVCKNLEKLDGRQIYSNGLPAQQATFLCKRDGATLVDNFLEYFFDSYDNNRIDLEFLYDENAVFSLSYRIVREKGLPDCWRNATHYQYRRHNLLDTSQQYGKYTDYGKSAVLSSICNFPATRHNSHTFEVDLMLSTTHFAVISVSGFFEELDRNFNGKFSFSRTFVLNTKDAKTWTILNDQLHVYHPVLSKMHLEKKVPPSRGMMTLFDNDIPSENEKINMIKTFQKLTGLSDTFCEDYLYKAMDKFDEALEMFIDDYENEVLPINAFIDPSENETEDEKERPFEGSLFVEYASENPSEKPVIIVLDDDSTETPQESVHPKVHKIELPASSSSGGNKPVASVAPNRQQAPVIKMQIKPIQKEIKAVPAVFDLSGKSGFSSSLPSAKSNQPSTQPKGKKAAKKYIPPKPSDINAEVDKEMQILHKEQQQKKWYSYI